MGLWALLLAVVFADPRAPARGADGSAARPFPTLAAALAAAQDGEEVRLAAGTFRESVVIRRGVVLAGQAQSLTILEPADGPSLTVLGTSGVSVRNLTFRGGEIGVQVLGGHAHSFFRVHFSGQEDAGLALLDAEAEVLRCSFEEIGHGERSGRDSHGVGALGGALWVEGSTFQRAGYRSIRMSGASGAALDNRVDAPLQSAIAVSGPVQVLVQRNHVTRAPGAAIYAFEARLLARDNVIEGGEYGLVGGRGAELVAVGNRTRDTREAGIAFVGARGLAEGNELSQSGIWLAEPFMVEVRNNAIYAPRDAGIHMVGGRATLSDNDIWGARKDGDGDYGAGIQLVRSEAIVTGNRVMGNGGPGIVFQSTHAVAQANTVEKNGDDGVRIGGGDVRLLGNDVWGNRGNGVAVGSRARALIAHNRIAGNLGRGVEARCAEVARLAVEGNVSSGNVRGAGKGCE